MHCPSIEVRKEMFARFLTDKGLIEYQVAINVIPYLKKEQSCIMPRIGGMGKKNSYFIGEVLKGLFEERTFEQKPEWK